MLLFCMNSKFKVKRYRSHVYSYSSNPTDALNIIWCQAHKNILYIYFITLITI